MRHGEARQLTKDQSLVQRLVDAGELTPEQAETSARRNIILQALGPEANIKVDLTALPSTVDKIVFAVSIFEAEQHGQSFGQVRNAFVRVVNQAGAVELARYDLSEDSSTETAMVFGELYRNGADWKFRAVGQGYANGLRGIATDFGVSV